MDQLVSGLPVTLLSWKDRKYIYASRKMGSYILLAGKNIQSSPADLNTWSDGVWQFTTAVPPQASNLQVVSTASGCGGGSEISVV
jgi:hypothetical protein